jgi:hypothetical protein
MSTTEQTPDHRALTREWLVARVTLIGGFIVAGAAAIYFGYVVPKIIAPREQVAAALAQAQAFTTAKTELCTLALGAAKGYGIVPQYGRLASGILGATDVQGRYVCLAMTSAARYLMSADLLCSNLKNPRCVSLYNVVSQGDGAVLFQRHS